MKVDKIIFSSDDSNYLNFWKINSEITLKKLGITPVLFHITDEESDFYEDEFGIVKKIKKIPNHSTAIQSQIIRMYATKFFPDEICLINDIDMFLFDLEYLNSCISDKNDDDIVILTSDAYDSNRPECIGDYSGPDRYPMCYVAAKGKTFNKILNTDINFEEYVNNVQSCVSLYGGDEIYFGRMVNNQTHTKVHKIKRGVCSNFYTPRRIEKYMFSNYTNKTFIFNLNGVFDIKNFIDCHCPFPENETQRLLIDKIKNMILND
jgi:hypothetical protein